MTNSLSRSVHPALQAGWSAARAEAVGLGIFRHNERVAEAIGHCEKLSMVLTRIIPSGDLCERIDDSQRVQAGADGGIWRSR